MSGDDGVMGEGMVTKEEGEGAEMVEDGATEMEETCSMMGEGLEERVWKWSAWWKRRVLPGQSTLGCKQSNQDLPSITSNP